MSPALSTTSEAVSSEKKAAVKPSSILHRTPWRPPVAVAGEGIYITLKDGRTIIDAVGGAAVACIGNGNPLVKQAIKDQVDKVCYVYNMQLSNEPAEELAKFIIDSSKGAFDLVGFVSGGSEAVEGLLKLAKQYFYEQGQTQRKHFISRNLSYHGNTISALSLSGHPVRRAPYEVILNHENFHHVSPAYAKRFQKPDETEEQYVERLRQELEDKFIALGPDTVIGFVAETVVGATTGAVAAPKGYFKAMKSVCKKYGALFMLDEVMSGMGRMGTLHAWESFGDGEAPDIQAVAKGLGGGYAAIGAVLVSKQVADGVRDGSGFWKHGHTYQANPVSCAASLAVQKFIASENLLEKGRPQGEYLGSLLRSRLQSANTLAAPYTFDVRGGGFFWGIEFDFTGPEASKVDLKGKAFAIVLQARCLEKGLIIMGLTGGANLEGTRGDHCLLAPAFNVTREEVEKIADIFVEVTDSIEPYPTEQHAITQASSSAPASDTTRILRSNTRARAAKKEKERETSDQTVAPPPETSTRQTRPSTSRRTRDPSGKGKAKETPEEATIRPAKKARRSTYPVTASGLTINEPTRDTKGKKRAAPEALSDNEDHTTTPSSSSKRSRTTAYSLRSRPDITTTDMPKKTRQSSAKGKAAAKNKVIAAAGPSRMGDEDVDMIDVEPKLDGSDHGDQMEGSHDESDEEGEGDEAHESGDKEGDVGNEGGAGGRASGRGFGGMDDSAAMAIFADYRQLGSYMMSLNSRLKTMLNNIKPTADPTTRLVTLQELSELLSISTEDTLAGSFQVDSFVRELVRILGGSGGEADDDDDGDDEGPQDDDAALAAVLALSGGGNQYQGDDNLEAQVLAARCLANLMEALPGVAHTVVYHGAIPVLCSKLIEISYIDLAEQTLSTLEKISEEFPSSIVRENGLAALLNYLDFFSIAVQRTALQAAANCCRNVPPEHFQMILGVWPIIRNCLGYSDQRLVEFACLCVIRVIDSYYRASPENLELLVDTDLIKAVNLLLLPAGGSPLIAANTFTLLLRALATSARASPKITVVLLEAGIADTLYQILTGVLPSSAHESEEQGDASSGQGLGGGLADMTVMQNLAHRPKDQIEEVLSLVSELMPPLPKGKYLLSVKLSSLIDVSADGVFDHKGYTEKALSRMTKAKAKSERAAARQAALGQMNLLLGLPPTTPSTPVGTSEAPTPAPADIMQDIQTQDGEDVPVLAPLPNQATPDRTEMLRSKPEVIGRFMQYMVPILIDVYAASVITTVRIKTLTGLLKAISFMEEEEAKRVLKFVPVASFASSILSSKDHPTLVIGALQLVELLLMKVPDEYRPVFRREGVFHEIETLAARPLTSARSKEKDKDKDTSDSSTAAEPTFPPPMTIPAALAASMPGFKKLSSLSLDPEDAVTLRSRVIRFKYLTGKENAEGDDVFSTLQRLVEKISNRNASEKELSIVLRDLAALFASAHSSVSSFELLQSGVIDALLQFATDKDRNISIAARQELFLEAFTARRAKSLNGVQSSFAVFVKKLQESLTRMESFDVVTVTQGIDDSKRSSSPSLLARQLRLRLVAAEGSDIPRNFNNIVVSIHAIATFQALHDYLRPRVAGLLFSGSRLSGMLAALASGLGQSASSSTGASAGTSAAELQTKTSSAQAESSVVAGISASAPATSSALGRRRSLRLSAKNGLADAATFATAPSTQPSVTAEAGPSSNAPLSRSTISEPPASALGEPAPSETVVNEEAEFAADFTDDEVDAEVFDDEMDADNSVTEKTVTLAVADDGSKVEAQTPDGTRVGTPGVAKEMPQTPTPRAIPSKGSYAAALKAKPAADWHLEFSMDDHILPLDLTIYGAIHQHELRKKAAGSSSSLPPSLLWQGVYTVKFKKVPGPAPSSEGRGEASEASRSRSPTPILSSLPEDAPHAKILRLLRVLHKLSVKEAERPTIVKRDLPESSFVNNKLTAKLSRQLEEPMIVASQCLPDWALDLPQHFPFLFPFATRYSFLQSTSFGYARLILKWQSQQSRGQDSSRRDDGVGFLGRLQRQKVRISRKHILESAMKVFELYGSSSSILEVEYFEEVGTGLGPTLEFYSLVSKEFARRDLKIWRDEDLTKTGPYVFHPSGLFPAPISPEDIANDGGQKRTHIFRVIGQFVAKAMLDSRIIDMSFNKTFVRLALGEEVPLTIETLRSVDADLANSLEKLRSMATVAVTSPRDKLYKVVKDQVNIEDLALDFTIPGYDVELRAGGKDMTVTANNVEEYIHEVIDAIVGEGAKLQTKAFREGFSKVFPITDLQAFTVDELIMLFGNSDEDWSIETLSEAIKADHGFNVESRAIRSLIEIMSEYDASTRREYLQFITGFRGLNPPLTVVRKPHEAPLSADDYLPSVMTCVNYLKLPDYSSKEVMREKLRVAMKEDLIMCRRQPGIAIGRLCEKCDGKCPVCDSYVRPETLVRICDECNFGTYGGRCIICGSPGISDAYYCAECTRLEKDRDGCPKIVNLGASRTDLFYERRRLASPTSREMYRFNFKDTHSTIYEQYAGFNTATPDVFVPWLVVTLMYLNEACFATVAHAGNASPAYICTELGLASSWRLPRLTQTSGWNVRALMECSLGGCLMNRSGPPFTTHILLFVYIVVTFTLATVGFAANVKYTQTIWIDMRDAPGGPALLIELELDHWINRMALTSYYLMEWCMGALLGAVFYNIDIQLAYLCTEVGTNIIYTVLVVVRILATRNQIIALMGKELAATYTSIIAVVVESAALYSILGILFIVTFATHSNLSNLIFLSISHVQGIAQLLIILRVAQGCAYTNDVTSQLMTSMQFAQDPPYRNDTLSPGTGTASSMTAMSTMS
ncbi:hypothetical protein EW146_g7335 [Bondarzewia mesenterica]|uniref:HECT-type E3 ubiquitin transferase n=1 Tax=Bondarzewia mesenterica TaxID=1095465 RepID=A0A4S4LMY9_9AGAM|nr:hypothetical protein EW146_g7335 [Bondarzewia mesenterica]